MGISIRSLLVCFLYWVPSAYIYISVSVCVCIRSLAFLPELGISDFFLFFHEVGVRNVYIMISFICFFPVMVSASIL